MSKYCVPLYPCDGIFHVFCLNCKKLSRITGPENKFDNEPRVCPKCKATVSKEKIVFYSLDSVNSDDI